MKRKILRNQNWSNEEKIELFNQVKNHINIIENRDPYSDVIGLRNRAWQSIHHEMKKKCVSFREVVRLKEAWSRMKTNARIEMSAFATIINKRGIQTALCKSRPSNLSVEVKRLLQSVRPYRFGNPKVKREFDRTEYLLQILESHVPTKPSENNSYQIKEEDPLVYMKDEDSEDSGDERSTSPNPIYSNANAKSFNDDTTEPIVNDKRKRHNDTRDYQEDNNEDIVSFAEIEYTKEDNKVQWSYDALNEEHKVRLQLLSAELEKAELQKQTALNECKMSEIKLRLAEAQANEYESKVRMSGERGSGAGQGGGGGGAIRNAGGSFGKMEAAHEDQYFYNQQKEQLKKMREELTDEISFHEEQIKRHEEAINRHKKRIGDMDK